MHLTLIEKIVITRKRLNLTCEQAARHWRVAHKTLEAWECGARHPGPESVDRLNAILAREEAKAKAAKSPKH